MGDPIVVDTCVFIRLWGKFQDTRDALINKCDTVLLSKPIVKEYKSKVHVGGMTLEILENNMQGLQEKQKLAPLRTSRLDKVKISKPFLREWGKKHKDTQDRKFIEAGVAGKAKCLLTTAPGFLRVRGYRYDHEYLPFIEPNEYLEQASSTG